MGSSVCACDDCDDRATSSSRSRESEDDRDLAWAEGMGYTSRDEVSFFAVDDNEAVVANGGRLLI